MYTSGIVTPFLVGGEASSVDGVVQLATVDVIVQSGLSLAELAGGMKMYPQTMINVRLDGNRSANDICSDIRVLDSVKSVEDKMGDNGRVLLRPSGTEPLIRVMVEGQDDKEVKGYAQEIADVVSSCI